LKQGPPTVPASVRNTASFCPERFRTGSSRRMQSGLRPLSAFRLFIGHSNNKGVSFSDRHELTISSCIGGKEKLTKRRETSRKLGLIGLKTSDESETRIMNLLGLILKLAQYPPVPLEFSQVYEAVARESPSGLSRTWVHRLLKKLVDMELIRVVSDSTQKKRYIADVSTVIAGLERLRSASLANAKQEVARIQSELAALETLDCDYLAQELIEDLTGQWQTLTTRFVRGVEDMHQVLLHNFAAVAKQGDTIRQTVMKIEPIEEGIPERTRKFFEAAKRGADVRYLVDIDLFTGDKELAQRISMKDFGPWLKEMFSLPRMGFKVEFRLVQGFKSYNSVAINNDRVLLMITEDPLTATLLTRDFNADLIDNIVKSFDEAYDHGVSMFHMKPEHIERMGIKEGPLRTALTELARLSQSH